jgi:hypothetical protein
MSNFAVENARELEQRHYVKTATSENKWGKIFKGKLNRYVEKFGDDFCIVLILHPKEDDGYLVIPYGEVKSAFTEASLEHSTVSKKSPGWNIFIQNNELRVTRAPQRFPTSAFHPGKRSLAVATDASLASPPGDFTALVSSSDGQGYERDPKVRRAIELHAMDLAMVHYVKLGYSVENKAAFESYDLRCTRLGEEVRVEVKGTRGEGSEVEVTINEVENARGTGWRTDLFVVSGIGIKKAKQGPVAAGGVIQIVEGWRAPQADLSPSRFRCRVPPAGGRASGT